MPPSKALRRITNDAARRWRCTPFAALLGQLNTPHRATLRLPVFCHPSLHRSSSSTPLTVELDVNTNSTDVLTWLQLMHYGFLHLHPTRATGDKVTTADGTTSRPQRIVSRDAEDAVHAAHYTPAHNDHVLAKNALSIHMGPPRQLHYPLSIDNTAQHWCDFVMRQQANPDRLASLDTLNDPHAMYALPPATHTRWFSQRLLDGFVSRRVCAHTGYDGASAPTMDWMTPHMTGIQMPVYAQSPYYAADEHLHNWAVFGEPDSLRPATSSDSAQLGSASAESNSDYANTPEAQLHRAIALSCLSALLPQLQAVWLSGAAVLNRRTGQSVLLLGPPRSGKTTLALHVMNASSTHSLMAHDNFALAPADAVQHKLSSLSHDSSLPNPHRWRADSDAVDAKAHTQASHSTCTGNTPRAGPRVCIIGLPGSVRVGLGAVLGSLHPNPRLAAHVQPALLQNRTLVQALLRNSEGVLWNMSQSYPVQINELFDDEEEAVEDEVTTAPRQPRSTPASVSSLAGIVWLGWSREELYRTTAHETHTRVRRTPLNHGGLDELEHLCQCSSAGDRTVSTMSNGCTIFKSHYLLNSIYTPEKAWTRMADMMQHAGDLPTDHSRHPPLCVMEGSVDFKYATQVVAQLLS